MRGLLLALLLIGSGTAMAQDTAVPFDEDAHRWQHRLLYVFAPSDTTEAYTATLDRLRAAWPAVTDRDLVVLALPAAGTPAWLDRGPLEADVGPTLRDRYEVGPGEAAMVLVGKDGTEKRRAALPADPAAFFAAIDRMPMRQREMRQRQMRQHGADDG